MNELYSRLVTEFACDSRDGLSNDEILWGVLGLVDRYVDDGDVTEEEARQVVTRFLGGMPIGLRWAASKSRILERYDSFARLDVQTEGIGARAPKAL